MQNYNTQTRLKELRKKKRITQYELAEITGINRVTIARWENSDRGMTLRSALKIAEALGCSVNDLVGTESSANG